MPYCHHCKRDFDSEDALRQHTEAKHSAHLERGFFEKHKGKLFKYGIIGVVLLLLVVGGYFFIQSAKSAPPVGKVGSVHWHANWGVFVNGEKLDMSIPKYQLRDRLVHMEDGTDMIHKHATGVTFGIFLKTLGWELTDSCLNTDTGQRWCVEGGKKFLLQIKNQTVSAKELNEHDIKDGDYYLMRYG